MVNIGQVQKIDYPLARIGWILFEDNSTKDFFVKKSKSHYEFYNWLMLEDTEKLYSGSLLPRF